MTTIKANIMTLDFEDYLSDRTVRKKRFVDQIRRSLSKDTFFFLRNHTVLASTSDETEKVCRQFFSLPLEKRMAYVFDKEKYQRAYTPMKIETGQFAKVADEKHFFQHGDDRKTDILELPTMKSRCDMLFNQFRTVSRVLQKAIGQSLGVNGEDFMNKEGNSTLRIIEYPGNPNPLADDEVATRGGNITGMCASKHTDINMITLLLAKEPGLQLLHKDEWLPITISDPSLMIVNTGDMLENVTGGRYKAGFHRVVCEKDAPRFSMAYFSHWNLHESVAPIKSLGYSDPKYRDITAGNFLSERLEEINLGKN